MHVAGARAKNAALVPKYATLPNPDGWFAVGFSTELRPGQVVTRKFFDRDLILFRTESGEAAMLDAHCPHMGAHLGRGGRVEGETIRCPYHGFRFATDGTCASTPYATKIPPRCSLPTWHLCERNGVILCWHHHLGAPPSFEIPTYDLDGWLPILTRRWTISSHPQETSENSVDLGHFAEVHKYSDVEVVDDLETQGPYLTARYAMSRAGFGLDRSAENRATFHVHVHGLGFSHVVVHEQTRNVDIRYWVLCTPTQGDQCEMRVACSTPLHPRPREAHPALALLPKRLASELIQTMAFHEFCHDLTQDFDIWANKIYVEPPLLTKGDGPVGHYRKWCRQFYPQLPQVRASA